MLHQILECKGCNKYLVNNGAEKKKKNKKNIFMLPDLWYNVLEKTKRMQDIFGGAVDACPNCGTDADLRACFTETSLIPHIIKTPFKKPYNSLEGVTTKGLMLVFSFKGVTVYRKNTGNKSQSYVYVLNNVIFSELVGFNRQLILFVLGGATDPKTIIQKRVFETLKKIIILKT